MVDYAVCISLCVCVYISVCVFLCVCVHQNVSLQFFQPCVFYLCMVIIFYCAYCRRDCVCVRDILQCIAECVCSYVYYNV